MKSQMTEKHEAESEKNEMREKGKIYNPSPRYRKIRLTPLTAEQQEELVSVVQNNSDPTLLEYCTPKNLDWIFLVVELITYQLSRDHKGSISSYDPYVYYPLILSMRFSPAYLMSVNNLYLAIQNRINVLYNVCPEMFDMTGQAIMIIDESLQIDDINEFIVEAYKNHARIQSAENRDGIEMKNNLL